MRKVILFCIILFILAFSFLLKISLYNIKEPQLKAAGFEKTILYKGCENGKDFTFDKSGNIYVAYSDRIQKIDTKGEGTIYLLNQKLDIDSIDYYNNKLYISSDNRILYYDLKDKQIYTILDNIPNIGDYDKSIVRINKDILYITVGTVTNSGVVGSDNIWLKENPYAYDITPKNIILKGKTFGDIKTGAFTPYGTKNSEDQNISSHFPGNGSIVSYDLALGLGETYAWGIRNITGLDFNSQGKIIAAVGGMENRGLRPIKNDTDYIYKIERAWYGWPDFSGGDPVDSPRFSINGVKVEKIFKTEPTNNPPAPLYVHKSLSTLGVLAVDSNGAISKKDTIFFYDKGVNEVYSLSNSGILSDVCHIDNPKASINIRVFGSGLYILDSNNGSIWVITKVGSPNVNNVYKEITLGLLTILMLICILYLIRSNTKNRLQKK
ncbi:MAG TPA: hypothetical protein VIK72_05645 [Clostridiaceae bacterium]